MESAPTPSPAKLLLGVAGAVLYALAMHYTLAVAPQPDAALALVLAPFVGGALLAAGRSPARWAICALAGGVLVFVWPPLTRHLGWLYYLQHAGIYTLLAVMFGRTLRQGRTPLVSRFATLLNGPLSVRHAAYTRRVTAVWTAYFVATVLISTLLFLFAGNEAWSIFANLLGTPLIVALFVLEFAVRRRVLPPEERGSLRDGWRAWKLHTATPPATPPGA